VAIRPRPRGATIEGVSLIGDHERERAAVALQRHYLHGRLSADELGERVRLVLRARNRRDLGAAFAGLPPAWLDGEELRRIGSSARRAARLFALTLVWLVVSVVLLIAFVASAIAHGLTTADAIGYPVAWLAVTALAWRARRRA
jgi:Domain of unknown function (DUF1707)